VLRASFTLLTALSWSSAVVAQPYVGIEIGSGKVRSSDVDELVVYRTSPAASGDGVPLKYDDVFSARWDRATEFGAVAGYDFGWVRVEGELARKRASIDHHENDDIADQFLTELNAGLNRPSSAPDPGAPGLPALTLDDFQPNGTVRVGSAMVNAFLDVPIIKGLSVYAGAGVGRSFARGFDDSDGALARQRMIGARYSVNDRIDVGLKYRKFASGIIKLDHDPIDYAGNPDQGATGVSTRTAAVTPDIEGEFRTRGVLLTLNYNLR
jgi:opacity protein-like surface antigen